MFEFNKLVRDIVFGGAMLLTAVLVSAQGLPKLLIVHADTLPPTAQMTASGKFSTVSTFDAVAGTPTLAQLLAYDVILAYSNQTPANPSGLGDVLADAVDAGRHVTVATYGISLSWEITGRMQTAGYNPLVVGTNGDVSGTLTAVVPTDPIFSGVTLGSLAYFHNSNFAHASLAAGAALLATDGAGINMIARSSNKKVTGLNLFPSAGAAANNAEFYKLLANIVSNNFVPTPIPTLSEWGMIILFVLMVLGTSIVIRRQRG